MRQVVLLFGASSIIGFDISRRFPTTVIPFIPSENTVHRISGWPVLQLENLAWIKAITRQFNSNLLVYCHAVCDVEKCEENIDWAYEVNVEHVKRVIDVLPKGMRLVYVSSDHVFGGDGVYTEKSAVLPISVYGRTRVEAESLILEREGSLVIRHGLVIGASPNNRAGHLDWLRYRAEHNLPITIVRDEYRSAVLASDLSDRIINLAKSNKTGIYHIPATRCISRLSLANYLMYLLEASSQFQVISRHQKTIPHLGFVELATCHNDLFSRALESVRDYSRDRFFSSLRI